MKFMRLYLSTLILICFGLMGCPASSKIPLGLKSDALPLDKALIGTWENSDELAEATLVKIETSSETNIYKLTVLKEGDAFMAESKNFTAWLTLLKGKKFLVLQESGQLNDKDAYYLYEFSVVSNLVITHDVGLKVGGVDAITSVKAYREEVVASMPHAEFLSGKIIWVKK